MGRSLEARIKRQAHKVLRRERELGTAMDGYQKLVEEAERKGIEVPKTALTNPLFEVNRRMVRKVWFGSNRPPSAKPKR